MTEETRKIVEGLNEHIHAAKLSMRTAAADMRRAGLAFQRAQEAHGEASSLRHSELKRLYREDAITLDEYRRIECGEEVEVNEPKG